MAVSTSEIDLEQIEEANASGRTPVVFVHGLWLLPSSWDRWAHAVRGGRLRAAHARLARRPRDRRGGQAHPEVFADKTRRPGRRPLRRRHRPARARSRPSIGHSFGGLLDPDPRRPRARGRDGRDRPGAVPRRAAAADLGAAVGVARAGQPGQPQPRRPAHLRAVPLRVRQRRRARTRPRQLYDDLRRAGAGRAALPGRDGEPQPVDRGEGRHRRTPSAGRC